MGIVRARFKRVVAVWVTSLLIILSFCPMALAWSGEDWGDWSRADIVSRAGVMIDSTWSPGNTINNFGYGSIYHYFYKGTTYTGEAYSQNNPQEDWSGFKDLVDNTGGGTTGYGNDCSGFASICWRLGSRYTTSTFEADATQSGGYVDSLGGIGTCESAGLIQGDGCVDSGNHIILFNRTLDQGNMESMEQTPWTACRKTWHWSSLGSYRPIRRRQLTDTPPPSDTPTPIPPPSAPDPSIQWLDQGLNSGDGQKVKVTCGMPANATELLYDMEGAGTNDYGWTGATSYTDTGVYDEQTVSVRCKARGPGGESGWSSWKSVAIGDRTPPAVPSPSIEWLDQGLNSRDTQEVRVTCALPSGSTLVC
ncbi:MAG: hypothetical protein NTZ78_03305, partial [Candidatus Aureabacteria bacterium]|nr:hypothetical protein [Candidatus Auribacterota bacterium]